MKKVDELYRGRVTINDDKEGERLLEFLQTLGLTISHPELGRE